MSYDNQIEFLKEYNEWSMLQKSKGVDITPDAFMLDRAKTEALEALIAIDTLIKDFNSSTYDSEEEYAGDARILLNRISDLLE